MLLILFTLVGAACAQEVSTEVLPSEDELLDALINGEIDYDLYLTLTDLLINGVDSTQLFIFDNVPGVGRAQSSVRKSTLEREQLNALLAARPTGGKGAGSVRYRYGQELEEDGRGRYRANTRFVVTPKIDGSLNLAREYTGRERILSRSVTARFGQENWVQKITVGSFRERFGLGTAVGYRGKLLDYSDAVDGESWLFPDWGGFNGIVVNANRSRFNATFLASYNRDSSHSISTVAAKGQLLWKAFSPTGILAVHRLANRGNGGHISVYDAAINLSKVNEDGNYELEMCGQAGERRAAGVVLEADHQWGKTGIEFDGWSYGRGFLDLASGSKAASLSCTDEIESVDFSFSNKRSGQRGALVKLRHQAWQSTDFLFDGLAATRGNDTSTLQGLVGVEQAISGRHSFRADFMYKASIRKDDPEKDRRRGRLEWQWTQQSWRVRTALGLTNETSIGNYWSLLVTAVRATGIGDRWQVWSNWRRVRNGQIDYWYGYFSITQAFWEQVGGGVKFSDTYNRTSTPRHSPAITLELVVEL